MTLSVWGEILTDADASGTRVFQRVTPSENIVIEKVRARLVYFNAPTITSLNMKLYTYDSQNEAPGKLIATSDSRLNAEIVAVVSDDYGLFETYFEFSPNISLNSGVEYAFVINGVWTFTSGSYLAWSKSYPDDPYFTDSTKFITTGPNHIHLIGADL